MTNTIILKRELNCWTATFNGPHGDTTQELFGTRTIPTAFTHRAEARTVRHAMRQLNPDALISFALHGAVDAC